MIRNRQNGSPTTSIPRPAGSRRPAGQIISEFGRHPALPTLAEQLADLAPQPAQTLLEVAAVAVRVAYARPVAADRPVPIDQGQLDAVVEVVAAAVGADPEAVAQQPPHLVLGPGQEQPARRVGAELLGVAAQLVRAVAAGIDRDR